ncbi:hypothetical protein DYH09_18275 [bacterium CPR1]|nr:hypothetical protein [bacterium CPR1]
MSELDRIETNFRLSLISQRETTTELRRLAEKVSGLAGGLSEVAQGLSGLAEKSDQTAERLEDSIGIMKSFAEGQVEIRQTLAECVRRLDVLEGKKAS